VFIVDSERESKTMTTLKNRRQSIQILIKQNFIKENKVLKSKEN